VSPRPTHNCARIKESRTRICWHTQNHAWAAELSEIRRACGGGFNHRFGLDDAILIKDNHIAVAGGIRAVLERAPLAPGTSSRSRSKFDNLEQLKEVLRAGSPRRGAARNMERRGMRKAVAMTAGRFSARSFRRQHARY